MNSPAFPLTVYYDGSCNLCSREIGHYRKLRHAGRLEFVDISAPGFDPGPLGRSQRQLMEQLHVRDAEGRFFTGVDAFPAIWRALPGAGYRLLADFVTLPGVHLLAGLGYRAFARLRPYLPKRSGTCGDGSCGLGHPR